MKSPNLQALVNHASTPHQQTVTPNTPARSVKTGLGAEGYRVNDTGTGNGVLDITPHDGKKHGGSTR